MVELGRYSAIVPDWQSFLEAASRPEPTVFRVRTGRIAEADLLERLTRQGFQVRPVDGLPSFYAVDSGPRPLSHTLEHWSGLLYVQQASTGVAAAALAPAPGERVLDLCASPGGKATHLAELMGERGCLVACEIDEKRMRGLLGNLYRLCVPNVLVIGGDGRAFPEGALFDRVLVDAPCSGEGTLRRRSGEVPNQSKRFRAYVSRSQRALLDRAVRLTRPGGTILYVTCTFAPEENEAIVSAALANSPVDLVPLDLSVPHARGLTVFDGVAYDSRLDGAARIYPHHLDSGGLFLAKLRRLDGDAPPASGAWTSVPRVVSGSDRREPDARRVADDAVADVLARHSIAPDALSGAGWTLRGDTVWMHTCGEWPVESWQPDGWRVVSMGVRAIEIDARGRARATNEFLRRASASIGTAVDFDREDLVSLLRGATRPLDATVPGGPVALRHGGEIVGRGLHTKDGLVSHVPKSRASDLARALSGQSASLGRC